MCDNNKVKNKDNFRLANVNTDNPMDYEFPKIEEYFIYNPKMNYPTNNPSALGGTGGIKMTKRFCYLLHFRSCR
jgi:hypothetical protein